MDSEKLIERMRSWLSCYRVAPTEGAVLEYCRVLRPLNEEELNESLIAASRGAENGFAPTPGQIWGIATDLRERRLKHGALQEMSTWVPSDPNWPEVKEFRAKLASFIKEHTVPMKDVPSMCRPMKDGELEVLSAQRESLKRYYAVQNLNDGLPRSKQEIEAIKASRGIKR